MLEPWDNEFGFSGLACKFGSSPPNDGVRAFFPHSPDYIIHTSIQLLTVNSQQADAFSAVHFWWDYLSLILVEFVWLIGVIVVNSKIRVGLDNPRVVRNPARNRQ